MAQGRSARIIAMSKWIRSSGLSIKNSLSAYGWTDPNFIEKEVEFKNFDAVEFTTRML